MTNADGALDELEAPGPGPGAYRGGDRVPDAPLLAGGVEPADTPGTGSVFAGDTATAPETLETMTPPCSSPPPARRCQQASRSARALISLERPA